VFSDILNLGLSIFFVAQGLELRKAKVRTLLGSKEALYRRGTALLICGSLLFLMASYGLIEPFLSSYVTHH